MAVFAPVQNGRIVSKGVHSPIAPFNKSYPALDNLLMHLFSPDRKPDKMVIPSTVGRWTPPDNYDYRAWCCRFFRIDNSSCIRIPSHASQASMFDGGGFLSCYHRHSARGSGYGVLGASLVAGLNAGVLFGTGDTGAGLKIYCIASFTTSAGIWRSDEVVPYHQWFWSGMAYDSSWGTAPPVVYYSIDNGESISQLTMLVFSAPDGQQSAVTATCSIGGNGAGIQMEGSVYDGRFYNGIPTTAERLLIAKRYPVTRNCVHHFKMCERTGTTIYDSMGNQNGTFGTLVVWEPQRSYSFPNKEGCSILNNGVYVPRSETDRSLDCLGNALGYVGQVRYRGEMVGSRFTKMYHMTDGSAASIVISERSATFASANTRNFGLISASLGATTNFPNDQGWCAIGKFRIDSASNAAPLITGPIGLLMFGIKMGIGLAYYQVYDFSASWIEYEKGIGDISALRIATTYDGTTATSASRVTLTEGKYSYLFFAKDPTGAGGNGELILKVFNDPGFSDQKGSTVTLSMPAGYNVGYESFSAFNFNSDHTTDFVFTGEIGDINIGFFSPHKTIRDWPSIIPMEGINYGGRGQMILRQAPELVKADSLMTDSNLDGLFFNHNYSNLAQYGTFNSWLGTVPNDTPQGFTVTGSNATNYATEATGGGKVHFKGIGPTSTTVSIYQTDDYSAEPDADYEFRLDISDYNSGSQLLMTLTAKISSSFTSKLCEYHTIASWNADGYWNYRFRTPAICDKIQLTLTMGTASPCDLKFTNWEFRKLSPGVKHITRSVVSANYATKNVSFANTLDANLTKDILLYGVAATDNDLKRTKLFVGL